MNPRRQGTPTEMRKRANGENAEKGCRPWRVHLGTITLLDWTIISRGGCPGCGSILSSGPGLSSLDASSNPAPDLSL